MRRKKVIRHSLFFSEVGGQHHRCDSPSEVSGFIIGLKIGDLT